MRKTIHFYRASDPHGYMSNFSRHPVSIGGKTWPTTEHYFQAQKFAGTEFEEEIRCASSPGQAAVSGRDRSKPLRKDWEAVKDDVMRTAVKAKFDQHPDLRQQLLDTEHDVLVEHTPRDSYWGDGGDGSGKNMLGHILMEVRSVIRADLSGEE